jgi:hypothetical protein
MLTIRAGLVAARDDKNECVGRLRYRDGYARIDNSLGLGNNFLCSTFLEIGRAISQCAGRASRIDRCPPALTDRAYLNSISFIVDCRHCLRCERELGGLVLPKRKSRWRPIGTGVAFLSGFLRRASHTLLVCHQLRGAEVSLQNTI